MSNVPSSTQINVVTPEDRAYEYWNNRNVNLRLKGNPAKIFPIDSVEKLAGALQQAVNENLRIAIRGGGHCLENFVSDPAVEMIIDISAMKGIKYDADFNAIEIMAGITLGEMHQKLYAEWGIVLPSGEHPDIGIGGHIQGGAFGFLCRELALGADYLYAVEVLWVNDNSNLEKTIATCEENDPNRELWWAHTGGGAGNFGVVTRLWFRTPGTVSTNPSELLPKAPAVIETAEIEWSWNDINEIVFGQIVGNFCRWCADNSVYPGDGCSLFGTLHLWQKVTGKIQMKCVLTNPANANKVLMDFIEALHKDVHIPYQLERKKMNWMEFALNPFPDIFGDGKISFKVKDAFLLKPFTTEQVTTMYNNLTASEDVPGGFIGLASYGGKTNDVEEGQTASVQRNAILTTSCTAGWEKIEEEHKYMEWVRSCYHQIYTVSNGVPVPGEQTGGCIIAHPDNDLANPDFNASGIPWYTFYYQQNYPRLQQIKAKWDPLNIFRHSLSVQA